MKLAMFTPGLRNSAIGHVAELVTQALVSLGHEVVVVRTENSDLLACEPHDFGTEVLPWTDTTAVEQLGATVDGAIYHLGNNYPYHRGCLEWLPRLPGVICVHDYFLGQLFAEWAQSHPHQAQSVLRTWYGPNIARTYFTYSSAEEFIAATRDTAPLTEWVCSLADGVVVHSSWGLPHVMQACGGPVRVVPLAYSAPAGVVAQAAQPAKRELSILTVGHVNANKRAESVISAIGQSADLRGRATYRLVGAVQPEMARRLTTLASALGVRVVLSGETSSAELAAALSSADIVCCLRWPTLESASASTIEAMLSSKAVVAVDTGFYAELPDDCVARIRHDHEVDDLQQVLERLGSDPGARQAMGERAAAWAAQAFSPANYAQQLVEITRDCCAANPGMELVRRAARQLQQWGGLHHLVLLPETLKPLYLFGNESNSGAPPTSPSEQETRS